MSMVQIIASHCKYLHWFFAEWRCDNYFILSFSLPSETLIKNESLIFETKSSRSGKNNRRVIEAIKSGGQSRSFLPSFLISPFDVRWSNLIEAVNSLNRSMTPSISLFLLLSRSLCLSLFLPFSFSFSLSQSLFHSAFLILSA